MEFFFFVEVIFIKSNPCQTYAFQGNIVYSLYCYSSTGRWFYFFYEIGFESFKNKVFSGVEDYNECHYRYE